MSLPGRLRGPRPGIPRPPGPFPRAACTTRPLAVTGLPGCASTSCLVCRRAPGAGAQRAWLRGARARGSRSRRHSDRGVRARRARRRARPAFPWQRGARPCGQERGKEHRRAWGGGTTKHPPSVQLSSPPGPPEAEEEKQPTGNRKRGRESKGERGRGSASASASASGCGDLMSSCPRASLRSVTVCGLVEAAFGKELLCWLDFYCCAKTPTESSP